VRTSPGKKTKIDPTLQDVVSVLRENYWHMDVKGAEAMRFLWEELATNKEGFEQTAKDMGVEMDHFFKAASLLGEWLRVNGMMYKSPMEASLEIRKEKLKFPEGPK